MLGISLGVGVFNRAIVGHKTTIIFLFSCHVTCRVQVVQLLMFTRKFLLCAIVLPIMSARRRFGIQYQVLVLLEPHHWDSLPDLS